MGSSKPNRSPNTIPNPNLGGIKELPPTAGGVKDIAAGGPQVRGSVARFTRVFFLVGFVVYCSRAAVSVKWMYALYLLLLLFFCPPAKSCGREN